MTSIVQKRTFASLAVGEHVQSQILITDDDVRLFAKVTHDDNPVHLDPEFAATTPFGKCVVHGALVGSLISGLIGRKLPGPGTIAVSMDLKFRKPVFPGSVVSTYVAITQIDERRGFIRLVCNCSVEGQIVIKGEAVVNFPLDKS